MAITGYTKTTFTNVEDNGKTAVTASFLNNLQDALINIDTSAATHEDITDTKNEAKVGIRNSVKYYRFKPAEIGTAINTTSYQVKIKIPNHENTLVLVQTPPVESGDFYGINIQTPDTLKENDGWFIYTFTHVYADSTASIILLEASAFTPEN